MIRIPNNLGLKITRQVGSLDAVSNKPVEIFSKSRVDFLSDLSRQLFLNPSISAFPELVTFAYWCRLANLRRMHINYLNENKFRLGLGLTYHICPSNVPVNFAYSMAFGLLSGNACVLRLSNNPSVIYDILIQAIQNVLDKPNHKNITKSLILLRFQHDNEINQFFMSEADGRIIWGGDETIAQMRSFQTKPRSREVAFSDRYSLCLIEPKSLLDLDEMTFKKLCDNLFNDIYLMDQAACSSPQLIVWIGQKYIVQQAQERLWPEVVKIAIDKYSFQSVHVVDKFVSACRAAVVNSNIVNIESHENLLYRIELGTLNPNQDNMRGYFGTVHEVTIPNLFSLASIVNERYQTMTVHGISSFEIKEWIVNNHLRGLDRVVPIGKALDMDVVWDGYDLINSLSRIIEI